MKSNKTSIETTVALMAQNIEYIRNDVTEIKHTLKSDYVTTTEFEPIKKIVFGLVGLVLTMVTVAVIKIVIIK